MGTHAPKARHVTAHGNPQCPRARRLRIAPHPTHPMPFATPMPSPSVRHAADFSPEAKLIFGGTDIGSLDAPSILRFLRYSFVRFNTPRSLRHGMDIYIDQMEEATGLGAVMDLLQDLLGGATDPAFLSVVAVAGVDTAAAPLSA